MKTKIREGEYRRLINGYTDPLDYLSTDSIDGRDATAEDWYIPELLSGSDYSGGSVTRSNFNVFKETYKGRDGVVFEEYGTYGTYRVAIRLDAIDEEIAELLDGLEDYPLIDEEDLSNLESEWENDAWDSWARGDTIGAVQKLLGPDANDYLDGFDGVEDDDFDRVYYYVMGTGTEEWVEHSAGGAWIDVDRLAAKIVKALNSIV